ncbi:hypothetical protein QFZ20_002224 [Flavobacterium sp. W4I14]|nr:hypothetical protein [Flavobacterium sp. W4I14]
MSNSFPVLTETQVVLSRVDVNIGIVLDENLWYATDLSQVLYTWGFRYKSVHQFSFQTVHPDFYHPVLMES